MSFVSALAWSMAMELTTGAVFPTVALADTGVPSASLSSGVTVTVIASPSLPLPDADRSNVSVRPVLVVVCLVAPLTFHS